MSFSGYSLLPLESLELRFLMEAINGSSQQLRNLYQEAVFTNVANKVINVQDSSGHSALHLAVQKGNIELSELIIQFGADVNTATNANSANNEGNTPLIEASSHGYVAIVKILLENDAKVDASMKDGTHAAFQAAKNGHLQALKLLTEKNQNIAHLKGEEGRTPLTMAARNGHLEIVEYLTSLPNVKVDAKDNFGNHAANFAAHHGRLVILMLLIQKDPNVADLKGYLGRTPLSTAAESGKLDINEFLTSRRNVTMNSHDDYGATALILATANYHPKIVQLLLEKGVNLSVKDDNLKWAIDLAMEKGHTDVIKLFTKSKEH